MSTGTNRERLEQNNVLLEDIKTKIQNLPEAGGGSEQVIHIDFDPISNVSYDNRSTTYGFILGDDGYYVNNNNGVDNSYCVMRVNMQCLEEKTITIHYRSYGESSFDFGIISNLDTELSLDNNRDSNVLVDCYGQSSAEYKTVDLVIPTGNHFIDFKYKKDGSSSSNDDTFKFKIDLPETISMDAKCKMYVSNDDRLSDTTMTNGTFGIILDKTTIKETYLYYNDEWRKLDTVYTGDANITAADLVLNKTGYSKGALITGNNANLIDTTETVSSAIATSGDLLYGKIAYVNGQKLIGTIDDYGETDYSNNNFELVGNVLNIKKAVGTIGFNGNTENVLSVTIPETMKSLFKNHKDDCIIYARKSNTSSSWTVYIYMPNVIGHNLNITCISSPSSSITLGQAFTVNQNENSPCIVATDSSGNNYNNDNSIKVAYTYANNCTETSAGSASSSTTNYERPFYNNGFYNQILCVGNDSMLSKIAVGSFFTYEDWSIKPDSIDGVTMNYKDLSQPMDIANDIVNHTSSFTVEDGVTVVDNGTTARPYESWTWTNPNGMTTLDESTYEDLEYKSYLRYYSNNSTYKYVLRSPYINRHLSSSSWCEINWSDGHYGGGNSECNISGDLSNGSTKINISTCMSSSDSIHSGTTNTNIGASDWKLVLNYVLKYNYYMGP